MNLPNQYIADVKSGKILACKWVKLAVQRHVKDLKTGKKRGLYFDEEKAMRAVDFFSLLKHYKGRYNGQPFHLLPWQAFFIYCIFGWMRADHTRRFRYVYLKVSRKNGKTTLASGICLYGLIADEENGAEIYTCATTKEQASICFKDAKEMVKNDRYLSEVIQVWTKSLTIEANASFLQPVASEAGLLDGYNPHIALIDEYHAHADSSVFDVMKSGMGARSQPIHLTITTAGFNKTSSCFTYEKTCQEILQGIKEDDGQFALMYDLDRVGDKGDDYLDEKNWIKANPSLGSTPSIDYLRQEVIQAKNNPTQLVNLLTKNFNQWTDSSSTWVEDSKWMECVMPDHIDDEYLLALPCVGYLDLANTRDVTAYTKIWVDESEDRYYTKTTYFLPEESMIARVKKDGVRYDVWAEAGWIVLTPGNVTDYEAIKLRVLDDHDKLDLQFVGYDSWNSSQLVIALTAEGVEMHPLRQGFISLSTPTKELEKMIYTKKILHENNPVTRWMLSNVELSTDPAGNIKPDKKKSSEKIDGIAATVGALGVILTQEMELAVDGPSRYDSEEGGLWVI